MNKSLVEIKWPNGKTSITMEGEDWLKLAMEAGIDIPTGCLTGSCGACEIEVDGKVLRACVSSVKKTNSSSISLELPTDPYW